MFSLDDLDITKQCDESFEFEVVDVNGKPTGVFIQVVGAYATRVVEHSRNALNARRVQADLNEKRGTKQKSRTIEEDAAFGTEMCAIRVIGWRGIKQDCTPDNAIRLCTINPPIKEQILKASEDLTNFTQVPATA